MNIVSHVCFASFLRSAPLKLRPNGTIQSVIIIINVIIIIINVLLLLWAGALSSQLGQLSLPSLRGR